MKESRLLTLSISIIVASICLGFFLYKGIRTFADKDRIVTVKGLAEMDMEAIDSEISFNVAVAGLTPKELIVDVENKVARIQELLIAFGIDGEKITKANISVYDNGEFERTWNGNSYTYTKNLERYAVSQKIIISHNNVKETEDLANNIQMHLLDNDFIIRTYPHYTFPELNEIKPALIAESTKNARITGEQFAKDSEAKLGKIKTASQGQITIKENYYYNDGVEEYTPSEFPYIQRARVVSTIVFFLE